MNRPSHSRFPIGRFVKRPYNLIPNSEFRIPNSP